VKELSRRQAEVAGLVAKGFPDKAIAYQLGLSVETVKTYIRDGARRIPGEGRPKHRLFLWFFNVVVPPENE
jgi:DNA-binding CsgD family transcriptional regulator